MHTYSNFQTQYSTFKCCRLWYIHSNNATQNSGLIRRFRGSFTAEPLSSRATVGQHWSLYSCPIWPESSTRRPAHILQHLTSHVRVGYGVSLVAYKACRNTTVITRTDISRISGSSIVRFHNWEIAVIKIYCTTKLLLLWKHFLHSDSLHACTCCYFYYPTCQSC